MNSEVKCAHSCKQVIPRNSFEIMFEQEQCMTRVTRLTSSILCGRYISTFLHKCSILYTKIASKHFNNFLQITLQRPSPPQKMIQNMSLQGRKILSCMSSLSTLADLLSCLHVMYTHTLYIYLYILVRSSITRVQYMCHTSPTSHNKNWVTNNICNKNKQPKSDTTLCRFYIHVPY